MRTDKEARRGWKYLLVVAVLAVGSSGFAQALAQSGGSGGLSEVELKGKGMFQQRCSLCHLPRSYNDDSTYGPKLSAATVTGREAVVREFIRQGSPNMPGFQYGLTPDEIDSIIAYLKTVK
jgi:mono/diheme cytochrome c family protein